MSNWEIWVTSGPLKGQRIQLSPNLTFGRKRADVNLDDPKASSIHAQVQITGSGQAYLIDQGSKNGIKVGGQLKNKILLQPGVIFQIGSTFLEVAPASSPNLLSNSEKSESLPPIPRSNEGDLTFDFGPREPSGPKNIDFYNPNVAETNSKGSFFKNVSTNESLFKKSSPEENKEPSSQTKPNAESSPTKQELGEESEWLSPDLVLVDEPLVKNNLKPETPDLEILLDEEPLLVNDDDNKPTQVIEQKHNANLIQDLNEPTAQESNEDNYDWPEQELTPQKIKFDPEVEASDPDDSPLRDSTRVLFKTNTQAKSTLEDDSTWQQTLLEAVDLLENQLQDEDFVAIKPFPQVVQMAFIQGPQINKVWYLGYGPRKVGSGSIDLPIYEPNAPEVCFELIAQNQGVEFRTNHPEIVLVNDKPCTSLILNRGDIIRIAETIIEVEFLL